MYEILFCLIMGVSSGDMLLASCDAYDEGVEKVVVRVAGIEAPKEGQPFAEEAKQALAERCLDKRAEIVVMGRDELTGVVTGTVECGEDNVGAYQVFDGLAWVREQQMGYGKKDLEYFYRLQEAAKEARRGLWADDKPVPPWEWKGR